MKTQAHNHNVYKSEEGRAAVEGYYRAALESFDALPLRGDILPTAMGATHVLRCGDPTKPPLILIHGSASNSASWLGILPAFAASFSVFCVDIPGEPGLSEPRRMDLGCGAPAEWLGQVLDGLGLRRAAFLGMSLGSFYALSFASAHPERAAALSLITTPGVVPQKTSFIFKAILCMLLGAPGQKLLNRLVYHKALVDPRILEFQALVSANFNPLTETIPIFGDEALKRITMPLQYFGGDRDALLDTAGTAARLSGLCPAAEIHVLPDTGHAILDQWPAIIAFLTTKSRV
jgi:pimeloyl-ACP methyl ester carboxylesterase